MKNRLQFYLVILVYSIALFFMGYCFDRSDFFIQLALYVLCFGVSLIIYVNSEKWEISLKSGLMYAFLLRMVLIISEPILSDDFYRFIFDGQLIKNEINPYLHLPYDSFSLLCLELNNYWEALLSGMNSEEYYSVYPPFHQLFFYIAAFGGENLLANIIILRLLILVFEAFTFYLLYNLLNSFELKISKLWLYAFNPLVILELTGNLHFEGIVLTGLLAALYFYHKNQTRSSGISWAWAVGVKLSPLMILPLWLRVWKGKSLIWFLGVSMFVVGVSLMPLVFGTGYLNFWKSFRLYQSSFEFNASLYYLIRWVSSFLLDYNPIQTLGPILNMIALSLILYVSFSKKNTSTLQLIEKVVWVYVIYLLFQTTVHPWYLIPAFGLSLMTKNKLFLVWTGVVFLSYAAYMNEVVKENIVLLIIQYGIVFGMIIREFLRRFTTN